MHVLTQDVNMLTTFSCAFSCTDLQSMNGAKYFEKPFINYSTINHTLRYKQVFIIYKKTLGTSNASTVYSVTLLFPGPLMK